MHHFAVLANCLYVSWELPSLWMS